MELIRLSKVDTPFAPRFRPEAIISGHTSLVWNERYFSAGEFSRESYDVRETLLAMPIADPVTGDAIDTFVSLTDSVVPMVVDAHKISMSITGAPVITTVGRCASTLLERRTTLSRMAVPAGVSPSLEPERPKQISTLTPGATSSVKPKDWVTVRTSATGAAIFAATEVLAQVEDMIDELELDAMSGTPPEKLQMEYQIGPGELYSWMMDQFQVDNVGFRAARPLDEVGRKILLQPYLGRDLSTTITFDAAFDQFTSSDYIISPSTWKNVAQVYGEFGTYEVTDGVREAKVPPLPPYAGLDKRVIFDDQSSVAKTPAGDAAGVSTLRSLLDGLGKVTLKKNTQTLMFSGEVSQRLASRYDSMRQHEADTSYYYLGDIVTLKANHNLSQFVRVAEYIRTDDSGGESAYPTFTALNTTK